MRRSADFGATVRYGRRAAQPDIVIHSRRVPASRDPGEATAGPKIGLIVGKSVGSAVRRHRVARRLRHVARGVIDQLDPTEQMVIRALPGSGTATSARLAEQLRAGLHRVHRGTHR